MNFQTLKACTRLCTRRTFTTSKKTFRTMEEFKELQRQMQVDDGSMVWLKKGPRDKMYFSCVLLIGSVCLAEALRTIYRIVYPKAPGS